MNFPTDRFSFLRWPLRPLADSVVREPRDPLLEEHLSKARYSVRLLRYWWAAQAIREEARKRGAPLTIVDYGSGRGWLKRFVGDDIDARWIALDWQPETALLEQGGYDEVHACNFDHPLHLPAGSADVVSALQVYEHLPRPAHSLTEIEKLLRPGGCFLAGTPTMPSLLARWRQAAFRRRLDEGKIARGGHINCLSPGRWRSLLAECGFDVEFVTGSHLVRHTGNPLENSRLWIRFNQLWGGLFPSLGSEACLRARKPIPATEAADRWLPEKLSGSKHRPRIALAAVAVALAVGAGAAVGIANARLKEQVDRVLWAQLEDDADHFLIIHHPMLERFEEHPNMTVIEGTHAIESALAKLPASTHIVLHEEHFETLRPEAQHYVIDSRIDVGDNDFYLIRRNADGTGLDHFLSTDTDPEG